MVKNTTFELDADLVDWKRLRKQKAALVEIGPKLTHNQFMLVDGVVNFLDYIQDCAVEQGVVSEKKVFGTSDSGQSQ